MSLNSKASLVAQKVKILPAMQGTYIQSLGREDPLQKEMATHSSVPAWRIPWTKEPGMLQSMRSQRVGHDWGTITHSFSSVHFSCLVMSDSLRPHGLQHTRPPCPSPTPGLYSFMSIESVMQSNHLILCCPLLLPPSIVPSIRVFSNESVLPIRWPKFWSFSFSISPSNEYSGLI